MSTQVPRPVIVLGSISVKVGRPFSHENHAPLIITGIVQFAEWHGVTTMKAYYQAKIFTEIIFTYTDYIEQLELQLKIFYWTYFLPLWIITNYYFCWPIFLSKKFNYYQWVRRNLPHLFTVYVKFKADSQVEVFSALCHRIIGVLCENSNYKNIKSCLRLTPFCNTEKNRNNWRIQIKEIR